MKAIALVTQSVLQSGLRALFEEECARAGVSLAFHNITEGCHSYKELFSSQKNVITWNCRMPHWWTTRWGANVLYIENSLLHQRSGIFIDRRGFFSNSNLCVQRTWEQTHDVDLEAFTTTRFGWKPMQGGNPEGPILVCLQKSDDSNLQQQFPLGKAAENKVEATMWYLHEYLPPDIPVIIRPNPRFLSDWEGSGASRLVRPGWRVDHSGSFYEILPRCRALATVNSTCASEALTLGLPVATLGTGAFSGSGATLECHDDARRLGEIAYFSPDLDACTRYAKAILGRHFLPYREPQKGNAELEKWLMACL